MEFPTQLLQLGSILSQVLPLYTALVVFLCPNWVPPESLKPQFSFSLPFLANTMRATLGQACIISVQCSEPANEHE